MLENDLILQEFLRRHGDGLAGDELVSFKRLLELSDGELWDLIGGRGEASDASLAVVVKLLRNCTVQKQ
jgi:succinate dehydrogenase flavin-adding protein (antitoxin of CptAB toxin-antitoxin module)